MMKSSDSNSQNQLKPVKTNAFVVGKRKPIESKLK